MHLVHQAGFVRVVNPAGAPHPAVEQIWTAVFPAMLSSPNFTPLYGHHARPSPKPPLPAPRRLGAGRDLLEDAHVEGPPIHAKVHFCSAIRNVILTFMGALARTVAGVLQSCVNVLGDPQEPEKPNRQAQGLADRAGGFFLAACSYVFSHFRPFGNRTG